MGFIFWFVGIRDVSDSNPSQNPHAHLLGAKATLHDGVDSTIEPRAGIIAHVYGTQLGIFVYVMDEETGSMTPPLALHDVRMDSDFRDYLRGHHKLLVLGSEQVLGMFQNR